MNAPYPNDADFEYSPVESQPVIRSFRLLHLAGPDNLGSGRRALLLALVSWVPIALWALVTGRVDPDDGESLLRHYSVHARCLIAIPLLVLAQPLAHRIWTRLSRRFDGLMEDDSARQRYVRLLADMRRLSGRWTPWAVLVALAILFTAARPPDLGEDSLSWAMRDGRLGFGGLWYEYFVHPLSSLLLLAWLWRIILMTVMCYRISRVGLKLVPTHPDRNGGLGLIEDHAGAMAPVTMALATILAARWAHMILVHGQAVASFRDEAIVFAIVWSTLLLLPQLMFTSLMTRTRRSGIGLYSRFLSDFGRKLHERWIEGKEFPDPAMFGARELGPYADMATLFGGMRNMRPILVGMRSLRFCLVPMAVPFGILVSLQAQIPELLSQLIKVLA